MICLTSFSRSTNQISFFVLVLKERTVGICTTDVGYKTLSMPYNVKYIVKEKILDVYKKKESSSLSNTLRIIELTLNPCDYVVIYKVTFKEEYCEKRDKYFAFSTSDESKKDELIAKKISPPLLKDKYQSHEIVEVIQPWSPEEPGFIQQINYSIIKYLKENGENDLEKEYKKSTAIGIRN